MTDVSEQSVAEVLSRAADLLEKPGAWYQGDYVSPSGRAVCMGGAINKVLRVSPYCDTTPAGRFLQRFLKPGTVAEFNDAPDRTQAEVVAKMREASAAALLAAPRAGEGE